MGFELYFGYGVRVELDTFTYRKKKYCQIYQFSSYYPKRGNAKKALKAIKKKYGTIFVMGIGSEPWHESWKFWKHMKKLKMVYKLYDDNGDEVR